MTIALKIGCVDASGRAHKALAGPQASFGLHQRRVMDLAQTCRPVTLAHTMFAAIGCSLPMGDSGQPCWDLGPLGVIRRASLTFSCANGLSQGRPSAHGASVSTGRIAATVSQASPAPFVHWSALVTDHLYRSLLVLVDPRLATPPPARAPRASLRRAPSRITSSHHVCGNPGQRFGTWRASAAAAVKAQQRR